MLWKLTEKKPHGAAQAATGTRLDDRRTIRFTQTTCIFAGRLSIRTYGYPLADVGVHIADDALDQSLWQRDVVEAGSLLLTLFK